MLIAAVVGFILGLVAMYFLAKKFLAVPSSEEGETKEKIVEVRKPLTYDEIVKVTEGMTNKGYVKQCRNKCADPLVQCPKNCSCCSPADYTTQANEVASEIESYVFGSKQETAAAPVSNAAPTSGGIIGSAKDMLAGTATSLTNTFTGSVGGIIGGSTGSLVGSGSGMLSGINNQANGILSSGLGIVGF